MDAKANEQMDRWLDRWIHGQMVGQTGKKDRWLGRQTDGYRVGQTERWTDKLMLDRLEAKWMQR